MVKNKSKLDRADRSLSVVSTSDAATRAATVAWASMPGHLIDGGEIVILAIKPSMWRPLFDSAGWLLAVGVVAAVCLSLGRALPGLSSSVTAQLVVSVGFVRLGLAIVKWVATWYLLTNRRIITVFGVRVQRVDAMRLLDVRNTYLEATPAERVTRVGTIRFATESTPPRSMYWRSIADPLEIHAKIRRAIENAIDQQG